MLSESDTSQNITTKEISIAPGVILYIFQTSDTVSMKRPPVPLLGPSCSLFSCARGSVEIELANYAGDINLHPDESVYLSRNYDVARVNISPSSALVLLVIQAKRFVSALKATGIGIFETVNIDALAVYRNMESIATPVFGASGDSLSNICRSIWQCDEDHLLSLGTVKLAELFILFDTQLAESNRGTNAANSQFAEQCHAYLQAHLGEKITIQSLADEMFTSPSALKQKYRDYFGVPVMTDLRAMRIDRALALLSDSDMSIDEIASMTGHGAHSSFTVAFKKAVGTSPAAYRKEHSSRRSKLKNAHEEIAPSCTADGGKAESGKCNHVIKCNLDTDLNIMEPDSTLATALGKPLSALVGLPLASLVTNADADLDSIKESQKWLKHKGSSTTTELQLGQTWQRWTFSAIFDAEGKVTGYQAEILDITDEIIAEKQVSVDQNQLFEFCESIPAAVSLIAPDYTVLYGNQEYIDKHGPIDGRPCYTQQYGFDTPCKTCRAHLVFERGLSTSWDYAPGDGTLFKVYNFPFYDIDGRILKLELVFQKDMMVNESADIRTPHRTDGMANQE